LDELLAAQSSIIAARPREGQSPGGPSFQQATVSRADMLAAAQVTDLPGSDSLLPPPQLPPATAAAMHAPSPERPGTTSTAACPRCGALNFDFVMRCVNCHLQLIQICPVCDKLNRSSATSCEFCGSMLNQPPGWSGVLPRREPTPQPPKQARSPAGKRQIVYPPGAPALPAAVPLPAAPSPVPPRRAASRSASSPAAALFRP